MHAWTQPIIMCLYMATDYNNSGADPRFWERGGPINIFTTGGGGVPLP